MGVNESSLEARIARLESLEEAHAEHIARLEAELKVRTDEVELRNMLLQWYRLNDSQLVLSRDEFVQGLMDLCTDDVVFDFGKFGTIEGKEGIRRFGDFGHAQALWRFHCMTNWRIDIQGDQATCSVYTQAHVQDKDSPLGYRIGLGRHDGVYARTEAGWKIKRNTLTVVSTTHKTDDVEDIKKKLRA